MTATNPHLDAIAHALGGRSTADGYMVHCPCHTDPHGSLHVSAGDDHPVLLHCFAGCQPSHIIRELVRLNLWPRLYANAYAEYAPQRPVTAPSVPRAAPAAPSPVNHAPAPPDAPEPPATHPKHGPYSRLWTYRDADGAVLMHVCRFELSSPTGSPSGKAFAPLTYDGTAWQWRALPAPRPLYGLDLLAARPDAPVLVVEGEKSADAARVLIPSHVVISWPNGASSVRSADWLPLADRDVTVWPDNDAPGIAAARAIQRIHPAARVVALPDCIPPRWDLADPVPDGFDPARVLTSRPVTVPRPVRPTLSPKSWTTIASTVYPELLWCVHSLLPEGLTMLAAPPKVGKTYLAYDLAASVGTGRPYLGYATTQGRVLYLDAESGEAAASWRLRNLGWTEGAENVDGWSVPRGWMLDDDGLRELDGYRTQHPDLSLIVVDTLQRLIPMSREAARMDAYQAGVMRLAALQTWTQEHALCVLVIHHTGKRASGVSSSAAGGETFDAHSGSNGLTGTAENLLTLSRVDAAGFRLSVVLRNAPSIELAVQRDGCRWVSGGEYNEASISDERRTVLDYLQAHPSSTAMDVSRGAGMERESVRKLLLRMAHSGQIVRTERGRFSAPTGAPVGTSTEDGMPSW